jgi:hypothetical protein
MRAPSTRVPLSGPDRRARASELSTTPGSVMSPQENALLNSAEVDHLATLIEEATRATRDAPRRFIEPARGTLDRAKSRRHHIVFGRRGSGKTSLLRKAGADLTRGRIPTAFIDLEAFKGHAYPDVLLSALIETLNAFNTWLATAGTSTSRNGRWWQRLWGGAPVVEAGLNDHHVILADGAIERLVLASGGVARDFLTIFRRAIDVAITSAAGALHPRTRTPVPERGSRRVRRASARNRPCTVIDTPAAPHYAPSDIETGE